MPFSLYTVTVVKGPYHPWKRRWKIEFTSFQTISRLSQVALLLKRREFWLELKRGDRSRVKVMFSTPQGQFLAQHNVGTMLRPFETMSQQCCDKGDVTRYDSQRRFLAQNKAWQCWNNVVTVQNDNNVAMLFCDKNGCCEFSCVTSP